MRQIPFPSDQTPCCIPNLVRQGIIMTTTRWFSPLDEKKQMIDVLYCWDCAKLHFKEDDVVLVDPPDPTKSCPTCLRPAGNFNLNKPKAVKSPRLVKLGGKILNI